MSQSKKRTIWEIVADINPVEIPDKKIEISDEKYLVHDNGCQPFMVHVKGKTAAIYKLRENFTEEEFEEDGFEITAKDYTIHIKTYEDCDKIFIPGEDEDEDKGNTVLLHFKNKYVFIGETIYEFSVPRGEVITKYISDIGNNDVPYPYAISQNYVFFLIEDQYVRRELIRNMSHAYHCFYGFNGHPKLHDTQFSRKIKQKVIHKRNIC